jgi:hypothetical protein
MTPGAEGEGVHDETRSVSKCGGNSSHMSGESYSQNPAGSL